MPALKPRKHSSPINVPENHQVNGFYVHSSPPKVLQVHSSLIRQWLRTGDLNQLEKLVLEGQGQKLVGEYSPDPKVRSFLKQIPAFLARTKRLNEAINRGDLKQLQKLLQSSRSQDSLMRNIHMCKSQGGLGLLHKAVYLGHPQLVEFLVTNFPETLKMKDGEGRTALHYCGASKEAGKIWPMLVKGGADPSLKDSRGRPAIYYMERSNEIQLPEEKILSGVSTGGATTDRTNAVIKPSNIRIWIHDRDLKKLQQVIWEGHGAKLRVETSNHPKVKRFLDGVPYILNIIKDVHSSVVADNYPEFLKKTSSPVPGEILGSKDANGLTPLHKAAGLNRRKIAENILERNPNLVFVADQQGKTPLHYAAALREDRGMYDLLTENYADVTAMDKSGRTAAYYRANPKELTTRFLEVIPEAPRTTATFPQTFDWSLFSSDGATPGGSWKPSKNSPPVVVEDENRTESENEVGQGKEREGNAVRTPNTEHSSMSEMVDPVEEQSNHVPKEPEEGKDFDIWTNDEKDVEDNKDDSTQEEEENAYLKEEENAYLKEEENVYLKEEENNFGKEEEENNFGKEEEENNFGREEEEGKEEESSLGREKEEEESSVWREREEKEEESSLGREGEEEKEEEEMKAEEHPEEAENGSPAPDYNQILEEAEMRQKTEREIAEERQRLLDEGLLKVGEGTDYEDKAVEETIEKGDMEKLASMVLNGEGDKLQGRTASNPEVQSFLNNVPTYLAKIRAVHAAARGGSLKDLQSALDRRKFAVAKESGNKLGATPLHVAVVCENSPILRYLAGRFPETLAAKDKFGRTPLHYAATLQDDGKTFNSLVNLGADPEAKDDDGHTPVYYQNNPRHLTREKLLQEMNHSHDETNDLPNNQGVSSPVTDPSIHREEPEMSFDEGVPLSKSAGNEDGEEDGDGTQSNFNITDRDEYGQSVLHFAAARAHGRGGLFQLIHESGVNLGYRDELYRTARDIAQQANIPENVNEIDNYVISLAARGETGKLVELFLEGYDHILDLEDDEDNDIQTIASNKNHEKTLAFLKAIPALEEKRNRVHRAVRSGNSRLVEDIVSESKNGRFLIVGKNATGRCSLHIAVLCQAKDVTEFISQKFPEALKVGDNLERTPLHYAMGVDEVEMLSKILIKCGAKRVMKDLKGRQPTYYFMNKTEILRLQEEENELKVGINSESG